MKKGCFIKSIILLTIVTAVLLYLINYRFNEIVTNPAKKIIANQVLLELNYVRESPEKDSLKSLIKNYVYGAENIKDLSGEEIGDFVDSLKIALADSIIDNREYKNLYKILNQKVN